MIHSFDVTTATAVGVNSAIVFNNFLTWCKKNEANEVYKHDGLYWTSNTVKALSELFPYFTMKQIRDALENLQEVGLLKKGNFNKDKMDRTTWYAVVNDYQKIVEDIVKGQMHLPCRANGTEMVSNADFGLFSGEKYPEKNIKETREEERDEKDGDENEEKRTKKESNIKKEEINKEEKAEEEKREKEGENKGYPRARAGLRPKSATVQNKFTHPDLDEIKAYAKERNKGVDPNMFYDYYTANNWMDSQGSPVRCWKQKMIAVWEGKDWWKNKSYNSTPTKKNTYLDVIKSFRTAMEKLGLEHNPDWKDNIPDCCDEIRNLKSWYVDKVNDDAFRMKNMSSEWVWIQSGTSEFWRSYLEYISDFVDIPKPSNFKVGSPTFNSWCKEMRIKE